MEVKVIVSFDDKSQSLLDSLGSNIRDACLAIRDESRRLDGSTTPESSDTASNEPSEPEEPKPAKPKRKRRTKAQIEADKKAAEEAKVAADAKEAARCGTMFANIDEAGLKSLVTQYAKLAGPQAVLAIFDTYQIERLGEADSTIYPDLAIDLTNAIESHGKEA